MKKVYSLCFMCSGRCPIEVWVENGKIKLVHGNTNVTDIEGGICPRGAAGPSIVFDEQRLKYPMIRVGKRGEGKFRRVSWEEALDWTANKLKEIIEKYGPESIVLGERANLNTHVSKTFLRAIGSPNHFTHDALCKGSLNTACRSLFGYTDAQIGFDYKNCKHMVFYGRNIFESVIVKEVTQVTKALEKGAKLTYIDPRASHTAFKATKYLMIRPGTDLALNYALMHVIVEEGLYDAEFVSKWVKGFEELKEFLKPYTPSWAASETGIEESKIVELAKDVAKDKPHVIFHMGYRAAHYTDEIYFRRSILMLNALLGAIEIKGGMFFKKGPGEVGKKGIRKLTEQEGLPKVDKVRFDKVGTKEFPLPDPNHGVGQKLPFAILNEDPYPIKGLIAYRFDPIMSIPDSNLTKKALDKLDLIVCIDINPSDIALYSDVILPESTYFERMDCVQQANGLKPQLFIRFPAIDPVFDTKPGAIIFKELAERLGVGKFFPYNNMEELVRWQLEPTGFKLEDFMEKGFVAYSKDQIFWDRENGLKFKTPSKKIEFVSSLLENAGFPSFLPYKSKKIDLKENEFRLIVGRCVFHTHVSTQNNPYLNKLMPENVLWINSKRAKELGIEDGDMVEVKSEQGKGIIKAKVTDFIHPEAVFMLHGFGHESPLALRSFKKGLSDALLQKNVSDEVGGSPGLHETIVEVNPLK